MVIIMFRKGNDKLDVEKINSSVNLLNKILKISYVLIVLGLVYGITILIKEWKLIKIINVLLNIITPFFIGFIIAWLLHPAVSYLKKKNIKRVWGTTLVYILFIGLLYWLFAAIIPVLALQMNDFISVIPSIIKNITRVITDIFDNINNNTLINMNSYLKTLMDSVSSFGESMTVGLPNKVVAIIGSVFSGIGTLFMSLIVGYYLLINFDRVDEIFLSFLPKKARHDAKLLGNKINDTLNNYVRGTLFVSFIIFITNYIGFLIIGVKSPLLFALFCGITNIIPYLGPYLGGIPVSLVALSQNTTIGILVIVYITGIQLLESMILQPIIMGKVMKLHPVTIIISLLIFGYFWGIIGMIVATPIVSILKITFTYFDDKYNLLKYKDIE